GNGPAGSGVLLAGSRNVIGGTTPGTGNLLSGNSWYGIQGLASASSDTIVQGNFIGLDVTGTRAVANNAAALDLNTVNNRIGGDDDDDGLLDGVVHARNIISGNNNGISLRGQANGTVVQGNYIGTDVTGTVALGNRVFGVDAQRPNITVGGTTAGAGNLISGNGAGGIQATVGVIQGNFIGTDTTGMHAIANGMGVYV